MNVESPMTLFDSKGYLTNHFHIYKKNMNDNENYNKNTLYTLLYKNEMYI